MPIEYYIQHEQRLVVARAYGTFGAADMFGYQQEVWTRPDVVGYDELVDMSDVEHISGSAPSAPRMQKLATLSAEQDAAIGHTKFAIVAPQPLTFGLGREYQAYREMDPKSTKKIGVFKTLDEALSFLGIDSLKAPDNIQKNVAHPQRSL